ncbi:MAG: hypothetical protein LBJ31_07775 [Treponema sp.]|jgi:hypothetical protein|nr:hypothetical protein [Treponema sp.]
MCIDKIKRNAILYVLVMGCTFMVFGEDVCGFDEEYGFNVWQIAEEGFVPNEEAAKTLALAYLKVIYQAKIDEEISINGTEYPRIEIIYDQQSDSWACIVKFVGPGTILSTEYFIRISKRDGRIMGVIAG